MSVITATDPDHLDIYGTKEAYLESFRHYTTLIQPGGALIIHKNLEMKQDVQPGVKVYEYSLNEGDFHAENIVIDNGEIKFDFVSPIENVKMWNSASLFLSISRTEWLLWLWHSSTDAQLKN